MTYRKLQLVNLMTGETEEFAVRISEEGIMDWLTARGQLRETGHPDRPPDVDTPTLRAWVRHPGEEHPYFQKRQAGLDELPEIAVIWTGEKTRVSWLMQSTADGWHAESIGEDRESGEKLWHLAWDYTDSGPLETDLREIADAIETDRVQISLPSDYQLARAEYASAEADVARGFMYTLPEDIVQ